VYNTECCLPGALFCFCVLMLRGVVNNVPWKRYGVYFFGDKRGGNLDSTLKKVG